MTINTQEEDRIVVHRIRYRVRVNGNTVTYAHDGVDLDSAIKSAVGFAESLKSIEITLEEIP